MFLLGCLSYRKILPSLAIMAVTLGVSTFLYFPFAVFNIASPILLLLCGITGFKIEKIPAGFNLAEEV